MLPGSLKLFAAEPQTSKGKYISGWVRTLNLNGPVFICLFVFVRSGVLAPSHGGLRNPSLKFWVGYMHSQLG